ncbi:MAG: prephenate dehydrogenase/arogenate dehydrogenase family protein [Acidimicrobiales bacterium]
MTFPVDSRRAAVVGTGLVGGSIGMALRRRGGHVEGSDLEGARAERARALGALDAVGEDRQAEITFVATPVGAVVEAARAALKGPGMVTDVGSVKAPVVAGVDDPRFVGGHPMAGSEQDGLEGADVDLFEGATWVLTPTRETDPEAYTAVRSVVRSLGADVVSLPPDRHDSLVALVSHVPHLVAATLMGMAADGALEHAAVLRLAAGGFRDMTRVAAGHPGIWLDICAENRDAIVDGLDGLIAALGTMRNCVAEGDREGLLATLERSREARMNLPGRIERPEELAEVRVPVPDRKGVAAEVTTLLAELAVNIEDLEIVHSSEGTRGVLVLMVRAESGEAVRAALAARRYRPSVRHL